MLTPTMDSMAITMPPPIRRVRVPLEFEMAMNTMTPMEPVSGSTVARTFDAS